MKLDNLLNKGIVVDDKKYYVCGSGKTRIREAREYMVCVDINTQPVFYITIFQGRGYYRPWVEVHTVVKPRLLYGTRFEELVVKAIYEYLPPAGMFYYEYVGDVETSTQLERGYPIIVSRMGYLLFKTGFTWFKDWYFAEGFMEGNPKLQGEKPLSNKHRVEMIGKYIEELRSFIKRYSGKNLDRYGVKALERAKKLLSELKVGFEK